VLSVITTWCDRPELARTLPQNLVALQASDDDFEIVVVNAGGSRSDVSSLIGQIGSSTLRLIDLPGERFKKAQALNVGAFCSRGERIFMVDADILLSADVMGTIQGLLAGGNFVTVRKVNESPSSSSGSLLREIIQTAEYVCCDGSHASIEYRAGADNSRCGPGLILVRKTDFISIGGFNSALEDWGFEDYDFQLRLQFALGLQRVTACEVVHLSHVSDAGDGAKKCESNRRNRAIAERNYCRGRFMGTYAQDVDKWRDRFAEVDPLVRPTLCA
jgi:glycosyl transferase family 7 (putative galactosyltransferase)